MCATSKSALDLGADVVIQSTHKLLGALTQGAMLHLNKTNNKISLVESPVKKDLIPKISRALSILQTSSPSYLLMASLDAARAQVQDPEAVKGPHAAATALHAWFETYKKRSTPTSAAAGGGITLHLLTADALPDKEASMDPWRFTVLLENGNENEKNFNFSADDSSKYYSFNSGWEAAAALEKECGVVAELATKNSIVFAVGMGTTMQHAEVLINGLEWLSTCRFSSGAGGENESLAEERNEKDIPLDNNTSTSINTRNFTTNRVHLLPEIVLTPHEALSATTKEVPWIAAANRISAELLCPYPPGVPAVYPGERIDQEVLDMLIGVVKNGGKVVGAADATLKMVTVIVD
jgi:arginine/lysine/ornithine decarboxylase